MRSCISIIILLFLWSCNKDSGWNCGRSFGNTINQDRTVERFHSIKTEGRMNIEIVFGNEQSVMVRFGENVLENIKTEVSDGILYITDETSCNWVRDLSQVPLITIETDSLKSFENRISGDIFFKDTIKADLFNYAQWNSNGKCSIKIACNQAQIWAHSGHGEITVEGISNFSELYTAGTILYDALKLKSSAASVNNTSNIDMECNAEDFLFGAINGRGNIFFTGKPKEIVTEINGSGEVIPY